MKVLVFSDIHSPFGHPYFLTWLKQVVEQERPDRIVMNGDLFDNYAWSNFTMDPDKRSQRPEFQEALKYLRGYYKAFPELTLILGNHDRRPWRAAQSAGISEDFMKSFQDVYCCPPEWEITDSTVIDNVLYVHGETAGGLNGWQNICLKYGMSTVIGHLHSVAGTRFYSMKDGDDIFSMAVGCGIDIDTYAFKYARNSPNMPVLSVGVIEDGEQARIIKMPKSLKKKGKRK